MRLLTDEQHALIRDALTWANTISTAHALDTLDKLQSVEVVGICAVAPNTGVTIGWTTQARIEHNARLYAIKKETP